jgi:hypothetical protein
MRTFARGATLAVLGGLAALAGLPGPARAGDAPEELKRIHILMVIDSGDERVGKSVLVDKKRMTTMWSRTIPADRFVLKVLQGKEVTRKNILAHYKNLRVGKGEGKVFYYAGHGVTQKGSNRHVFQLSSDELLPRDEVRAAMDPKKTDLVVLLSDCCSTVRRLELEPDRWMDVIDRPQKIHPTVSCLFFRSRGVVDITAATDNASWGDDTNGGVFTRTLCGLLLRRAISLDANKDGFVDWGEFFDKLKNGTQAEFGYWREDVLDKARGMAIEIDPVLMKKDVRQVPKFFGQLPRRADAGWLLACLRNKRDEPLVYEIHWEGGKWEEYTLKPGQKRVHCLEVKKGDPERPRLEVRVKGRAPRKVETEWKSGNEKPTRDEAKRVEDIP